MTLYMLSIFFHDADFYQNELFQTILLRTLSECQRVGSRSGQTSKGLDPDLDKHFVGPDLGPNCLPRL